MSNGISFIVPGEAVAKGRPRFRRIGKYVSTYSPEKTVNYEQLVKLAFQQGLEDLVSGCRPAMESVIRSMFPLKGPVSLTVKVYRHPQKSLSNKRKKMALEGKVRPVARPDCSNILKAVEDSLNGLAFADDGQLVDVHISKWFSEQPRVEIDIKELSEA